MASALLRHIGSMAKLGTIGFGGGSALIPLFEKELVQRRRVLGEEEFTRDTVVSNVTPGGLPTKLAGLSGLRLAGVPGSVLGGFAATAPGTAMVLGLVALFGILGPDGVLAIEFASVGISAYVVVVLLEYVVRLIRTAPRPWVAAAITVAVAALTGLDDLARLLGLALGQEWELSLPQLSSVAIVVVALALIILFSLLTGWRRRWAQPRLHRPPDGDGAPPVPGSPTPGAGGGSEDGSEDDGSEDDGSEDDDGGEPPAVERPDAERPAVERPTPSLVAGSTAGGDAVVGGERTGSYARPALLAAAILAALMAVGMVASWAVAGIAGLTFMGLVALSMLATFGGGNAYIAVGAGFFVTSGLISADMYYGQLVPVANATPGPLIMKLASEMGWVYGVENYGVVVAVVLALSALIQGVGASNITALVVFAGYERYADAPLLRDVAVYILPVIGGMLVTTAANMAVTSARFGGLAGVPAWAMVWSFAALALLIWAAQRRFRIHDVVVIFVAGALTLGVLWGIWAA